MPNSTGEWDLLEAHLRNEQRQNAELRQYVREVIQDRDAYKRLSRIYLGAITPHPDIVEKADSLAKAAADYIEAFNKPDHTMLSVRELRAALLDYQGETHARHPGGPPERGPET